MATLFLFASTMTDHSIASITLDVEGQVINKLKDRPYADLKKLQIDKKVVIVIPTSRCRIFLPELPKMDARKARTAIPFALEEEIAESLNDMHFAFSYRVLPQSRLLVVAVGLSYLNTLTETLQEHQVSFDEITPDWFVLNESQVFDNQGCITVRSEVFNGALDADKARDFLKSEPSLTHASLADRPLHEWMALELHKNPRLNLCQGELTANHLSSRSNVLTHVCYALIGLCLITWFGFNTMKLVLINKQTNQTDSQIAIVYKHFFPEAKRVISPRFRISELLNSGKSNPKDILFWTLFSPLTKVFPQEGVRINEMRYQNDIITLSLLAKDFTQLESVRAQLQKQGLKVSQSQANSQKDGVEATMELSR